MEDNYEQIFRRKSVRSFDGFLDEADKEAIKDAVGRICQLDGSLKEEAILGIEHKRGEGSVQIFGGGKEPIDYLNAGYMLEQADLMLSAQNIGSCYLGVEKPVNQTKDGKDFLMMIEYGKTDPSQFRSRVSDYPRNYINDVWEGDAIASVKNAVLVTPSDLNSQPWKVVSSENKIEVFVQRKDFNAISDKVMAKFHYIDVGALLCHLEMALDHFKMAYEKKIGIEKEVGRLTKVAEYNLKLSAHILNNRYKQDISE